MAGAYLHRPTTLSLWSLRLLMECPQDHFTLDALEGQGGGEKDGVMGGDIYYYDMFFLAWISKYMRKDLHVAHDSFLFMRGCYTTMEDLFMGPYIFLLLVHGNNLIFSFVDCLT